MGLFLFPYSYCDIKRVMKSWKRTVDCDGPKYSMHRTEVWGLCGNTGSLRSSIYRLHIFIENERPSICVLGVSLCNNFYEF